MDMPAKKTSTKTPNKSDFIRSQPATLSAAEVVAKGKADGVTILPGLVYEVRRKAKAPATGKASKADFVRSLPSTTPASEVIAKGKAAGLKLTQNYVYKVRTKSGISKAKKTSAAKPTASPTSGKVMAAKKKRAAAKSPAVSTVVNGGGSRVSASAENLLLAVAAEIGLGSAIEVLQGERVRVRTLIGA
jgi:hypothetical protein